MFNLLNVIIKTKQIFTMKWLSFPSVKKWFLLFNTHIMVYGFPLRTKSRFTMFLCNVIDVFFWPLKKENVFNQFVSLPELGEGVSFPFFFIFFSFFQLTSSLLSLSYSLVRSSKLLQVPWRSNRCSTQLKSKRNYRFSFCKIILGWEGDTLRCWRKPGLMPLLIHYFSNWNT